MTFYQYRKSHCGDKTILRPSYLHNRISYTGKITSLYWIRAQGVIIDMYLQAFKCLFWISKETQLVTIALTDVPATNLGIPVPLRSRHFLSQKLWHFDKDTRSCVENECCCPRTVNISNVNFTSKISMPPEPVFKTWDSKWLALIAQMVRAFGMNPRNGRSSPPQVETFLSQKLWRFHKNTRSCVENECCCPRTGDISNVDFTFEKWAISSTDIALTTNIDMSR